MKGSNVRNMLMIAVLAAGVTRAPAEVRLHGMFTDGMVLQQGVPAPVWGMAAPNEEVTVEFAGQKKTAKADADGRWLVRLDSMPASAEPRTMVVRGSIPNPPSEIRNVLVGEVWICSGQSNMQWTLGNSENGTNDAQNAADPLLRLYQVPMIKSDNPLSAVTSRWTDASFSNVIKFTAVGYYFGKNLRRAARQVPVGLVQTAWGGTPAESWTPREKLEADAELRVILDEHAKAVQAWDPVKVDDSWQKQLANWSNQLAKAREAKQPPPRRPQKPESPANKPRRPCCLYNAMIHPLLPYAIRGAIWYQGESNAGRAKQYETLFPTMIASWREAWGLGDFPFLFVQIAPHANMGPEIREAQLVSWQKTPKTAMTVITDVGEQMDIHPKKKAPVGARLALAARALAYGEDVVYSGPVFKGMRTEAGKAILEFDHAGGGLVAAEGGLKDFVIAGADGKFVAAQAAIDGARVVVSSPEVAEPKAVRYGWLNYFVGSLFNREGLPATPFRTDRPQ